MTTTVMKPRRRRRGEVTADNFAGGGGATSGIERAWGRHVDIAINHDREAVEMHKANHPDTQHFCQDILTIDPRDVVGNNDVPFAWFSPDCKHFSRAKGGKPRDKNIRDLAWVVERWARLVHPRVIFVENVEEFQTWGPLDDDGYPIKAQAGETFREWVRALEAQGYKVEWRMLRACDYGSPTIRRRLFVIARCDGKAIVWPEPTHGNPFKFDRANALAPYRTAGEIIDWDIECPSIFERSRELADNTKARIATGIWRHVVNAERPFIVPVTHHGGSDRVYSLDDPLNTITGAHRGELALASPFIARTAYRGANGQYVNRVDEPYRTITAQPDGASLIAPTLLQVGWGERDGQAPRALDLAQPLGTTPAGGIKHALAASTIVRMNHRGMGKPADSLHDPAATVTTQHNHSNLVMAFMAQHNGGMVGKLPDQPLSTITQKGAQTQLAAAFLDKAYGTGVPQSLYAPAPTVLGGGERGGGHIAAVEAFLMHYWSGGGQSQSLHDPVNTLRAKGQAALGLVWLGGEPWQIVDIGMRMLTPRELYRAQGFGEDYIIDPEITTVTRGRELTRRLSKTAQVRMVGNSVCPQVAEAVVAANVTPGRTSWGGFELSA